MSGRTIKRTILIGVPVALVLLCLAAVFYLRSLALERSQPVSGRYFVSNDVSLAALISIRPEDKGIRELLQTAAAAYDAQREKDQGTWDSLTRFALGFDRPSDVVTRLLPIEGALIVRYDTRSAQFHSFSVCSVSGMAGLLNLLTDRLSWFSSEADKAYGKREHSDERLFVPQAGSDPPGPRLEARDFAAMLPTSLKAGSCWTLIRNNILISRRPESLALAVDRLKAIYANAVPSESVLAVPDTTGGVDCAAALSNDRGELACLLEMVASGTHSKPMLTWLKTEQGLRDLAAVRYITATVDVQPGDKVAAVLVIQHTNYESVRRIVALLGVALEDYRLPPPMRLRYETGLAARKVEIRVTFLGLGEYVRRSFTPGAK